MPCNLTLECIYWFLFGTERVLLFSSGTRSSSEKPTKTVNARQEHAEATSPHDAQRLQHLDKGAYIERVPLKMLRRLLSRPDVITAVVVTGGAILIFLHH